MADYMLERYRVVSRWREYLPALRGAVARAVPGAEAYVYGGVVGDRVTALSDIDVLLVLDREPSSALERARVKAAVREWLERLGVEHSYVFDIHVVGREEAQRILGKAKALKML